MAAKSSEHMGFHDVKFGCHNDHRRYRQWQKKLSYWQPSVISHCMVKSCIIIIKFSFTCNCSSVLRCILRKYMYVRGFDWNDWSYKSFLWNFYLSVFFLSANCIWKYRLQSINYFVPVAIWQWLLYHLMISMMLSIRICARIIFRRGTSINWRSLICHCSQWAHARANDGILGRIADVIAMWQLYNDYTFLRRMRVVMACRSGFSCDDVMAWKHLRTDHSRHIGDGELIS